MTGAIDRIILASKSPRRSEILSAMGVCFEVVTAETDEDCRLTDPVALVEELAERKGRAVLDMLRERGEMTEGTLIIAADTVVYRDGVIMGKPKDNSDAARMLRALSGGAHTVTSGIAILYGEYCKIAHESTEVVFDTLSEENIADYIKTGEPSDKAGAYAVQGKAALYIKSISGSYFNVVGLPVRLLYTTVLGSFGIDITKAVKKDTATGAFGLIKY